MAGGRRSGGGGGGWAVADRRRGRGSAEEWPCQKCKTMHCSTRQQCRRCAAHRSPAAGGGGGSPSGDGATKKDTASPPPSQQQRAGGRLAARAPQLLRRLEKFVAERGTTELGQALSTWQRGVVDAWPCRPPPAAAHDAGPKRFSPQEGVERARQRRQAAALRVAVGALRT
eukprot:gene5658-9507_t